MSEKWLHNISEESKTYQGREIESGGFYQIPYESQLAFSMDSGLVDDILAETVAVSWNGADDFTNLTAAIAYLRSFPAFNSSFAVDKNDDTPQTVSTTDATLITAHRILWDFQEEYDLDASKFYPSLDGVWNFNGTITIESFANVARVKLQIFRNDESYFTVVDIALSNHGKRALTFTCDVDAYASEEHTFDLRLELEAAVAEDPVEAVISGMDEETAWGMTFLQGLIQASPT